MRQTIVDWMEFSNEQRCDSIRVTREEAEELEILPYRVIFANGALSTGPGGESASGRDGIRGVTDNGELHKPPPKDKKLMAYCRRAFVQAMLLKEEKHWQAFKQQTEARAEALSGRESEVGSILDWAADCRRRLTEGKKRIVKLRNELAKLNAKIAKFPEERAKRKQAKAAQAQGRVLDKASRHARIRLDEELTELQGLTL